MPLGPGLSQEHASRSQPIRAMRHPAPSLLRPTPSNDLWPPTHGSCQNTGSCEPVASSCVCVYIPTGYLFIFRTNKTIATKFDRLRDLVFSRHCGRAGVNFAFRERCLSKGLFFYLFAVIVAIACVKVVPILMANPLSEFVSRSRFTSTITMVSNY